MSAGPALTDGLRCATHAEGGDGGAEVAPIPDPAGSSVPMRGHAALPGVTASRAVNASGWNDVGSSYRIPGRLPVLQGEIRCNYPEGSDPRSVSHNTDLLLGADREITGCVLNKGASFLPSGREDEVLRFEEKSVGWGLRIGVCAGLSSAQGLGEGMGLGGGRSASWAGKNPRRSRSCRVRKARFGIYPLTLQCTGMDWEDPSRASTRWRHCCAAPGTFQRVESWEAALGTGGVMGR